MYATRVSFSDGTRAVGLAAAAEAAPAGETRDALFEAKKDGVRWRDADLKEGATVVLTHNVDVAHGLFNGAVGVVERCLDSAVRVHFRSTTTDVQFVEFQVEGGARVAVMPLRAAYSYTVHRSQARRPAAGRARGGFSFRERPRGNASQGLTLDAAEVHLRRGMGAGAAYTALSRVRGADSLVIHVEGVESAADARALARVLDGAFVTAPPVLKFLDEIGFE